MIDNEFDDDDGTLVEEYWSYPAVNEVNIIGNKTR
jgi:hypothetical protein